MVVPFIVITASVIFILKFLYEVFKKVESSQEPQVTIEATFNTIKEPFIYFRPTKEDRVCYAYSPISDTLIVNNTSEIHFGNIVIRGVSNTYKHHAIVRGFLNESREGFVQYEKVEEAAFFHLFRLAANKTASTFNPILRNQFDNL